MQRMKADIEKAYGLKAQLLGPDNEDSQHVRVLNRLLTWTKDGTRYEADTRHAEIVINEDGLEDATGAIAPGRNEEGSTQSDNEEKLDEYHTSQYRAIVARLSW